MALTVLGLADIRAGYRDVAARHLQQALLTTLQAGVTATAVGGLGELATGTDGRARAHAAGGGGGRSGTYRGTGATAGTTRT
jgi:hypothetical protein